MYNSLFIYGFSDKEFLQELYNNFNISYSIHTLDDVKKDQDHRDLIIDNFRELPKLNKDAQKIFIKFYNDHFITFSRMFVRKNRNKMDFHEDSNHFALYFYAFYEIIINKKIDLIHFQSFPHLGPDYILYHIAKILKIRTVLIYQTIFPQKYIMLNDIEDLGKIKNNTDNNSKVDHLKILNEKDFYTNIQNRYYEIEKNNRRKFIKKISNFLSTEKFFRKFFRKFLIKSLIKIHLIKRKDDEKEYKKNLEIYSSKKETIDNLFNSNKKIIYFPLQSQPELGALLGKDYDDQLRVIEKLITLLGNEWIIIVKDHYIQTSYQRKHFFFKRLSNLKNTYIANPNYSGIELIQKSDIVATCFGTSGWEALTNKKKCLLFGNSWYSGLSGVLKIDNHTDDEKIFKFIKEKFNEEKFNLDLSNLYSSFYEGYTVAQWFTKTNKKDEEFDWFDLIDEKYHKKFDKKENTKKIINNFKSFLKQNNNI